MTRRPSDSNRTLGAEKRAHRRVDRRIELRYAISDGKSRPKSRAATTLNVGAGGLFLVVDGDPPAPGTRLHLSLPLGARGALELDAEVRWTVDGDLGDGRSGVGVRFADLDAAQSLALAEHFGAEDE